MLELALFRLIFYNFRQLAITSGLIFHCWEAPALRIFTQWASTDGLYVQLVNLGHLGSNNGTKFIPKLKEQYFHMQRPVTGVYFDLNCEQSAFVMNQSHHYRLFNEHFHWLLYDRSQDVVPFRKIAEKMNFFVNSDVTLALSSRSGKRTGTIEIYFTLYDVYNNGNHIGGKLNITIDRRIACTEVACRLNRYLSTLHERTRYANRNSQRDVTIRTSTVITTLPMETAVSEKFQFLYSNNNTYVDPVPRFGYRQFMVILDMLYVNQSTTFYDRWSTTDVFGGSLETMINGTADFSTTPIAMTTFRLKYLQIIAETGSFHSICMFRTPRNSGLTGSGRAFLDPFTLPVWIAFVTLIVLSSIQFWGIFFVEFYRMPQALNHAPSLLTSCLITVATACVQGAYVLPSSVGGRVTYTVVALSTFLMYNYYTSIIVSTLLGTHVKSDIKTVGQIADSALDIGFEPRPWIFSYLNSSEVPAVRRLVKKKIEMRKNPRAAWVPVDEGVQRIRDEIGTFGYVFEGSTGLALIEKYYKPEEICDLNEVKLRPESSLANQLPKNSSFKELFRLRLLRVMETGVNRRMAKYWLRNRLNCFASNTIVEVGLEYTAPLFLLMFITYAICLFVLMFEVLFARFGNRRAIESLCL